MRGREVGGGEKRGQEGGLCWPDHFSKADYGSEHNLFQRSCDLFLTTAIVMKYYELITETWWRSLPGGRPTFSTVSGGASTSRQPGDFQASKVVRQVIYTSISK